MFCEPQFGLGFIERVGEEALVLERGDHTLRVACYLWVEPSYYGLLREHMLQQRLLCS